jgi:hypothetical protein
MLTTAQTGDKIVLLSHKYANCDANPVWGGAYGYICGTVVSIKNYGLPVRVKWDNGHQNVYAPEDLGDWGEYAQTMTHTAAAHHYSPINRQMIRDCFTQLITKEEKPSEDKKMNPIQKLFLDVDTKILIEAGYLDDCRDLTGKGHQILLSIMVEANKAKLVEMAKVEVEEQKAKKSGD